MSDGSKTSKQTDPAVKPIRDSEHRLGNRKAWIDVEDKVGLQEMRLNDEELANHQHFLEKMDFIVHIPAGCNKEYVQEVADILERTAREVNVETKKGECTVTIPEWSAAFQNGSKEKTRLSQQELKFKISVPAASARGVQEEITELLEGLGFSAISGR